MLSQWIIRELEQALDQVCLAAGTARPESVITRIEQPANIEHGDYSTNIAMQLAKHLRQAPLHIAEAIKNELNKHDAFKHVIHTIDIAAPGFINLRINWRAWADMTFALPATADEKVVIEHTSINPNKSAHIGHLRNACIGDTLVRLMKKPGTVSRPTIISMISATSWPTPWSVCCIRRWRKRIAGSGITAGTSTP